MPAEFLSDEQRAAYGSFEELPSLSDLEKFFVICHEHGTTWFAS